MLRSLLLSRYALVIYAADPCELPPSLLCLSRFCPHALMVWLTARREAWADLLRPPPQLHDYPVGRTCAPRRARSDGILHVRTLEATGRELLRRVLGVQQPTQKDFSLAIFHTRRWSKQVHLVASRHLCDRRRSRSGRAFALSPFRHSARCRRQMRIGPTLPLASVAGHAQLCFVFACRMRRILRQSLRRCDSRS